MTSACSRDERGHTWQEVRGNLIRSSCADFGRNSVKDLNCISKSKLVTVIETVHEDIGQEAQERHVSTRCPASRSVNEKQVAK